MRCEARLEPQNVAGRHLSLGDGMQVRDAAEQACRLELAEMLIQRRSADLAIMRQPLLRGKAAIVRVEPVTEMPEYDLGRGLQSPLLDSPICGSMAHGATLPVGEATRVVNP